jgi:hypothetical protein
MARALREAADASWRARRAAAAHEHHHDVVGARLLGEEFGVSGKRDPGVVDHALLHRGGHHGVVFARRQPASARSSTAST